jgi:hypothetical protein
MSERNEAESQEPMSDESGASGRDIRFLKEKQRKGPGALVFAVLLLVVGIVYALFVRSTMLAPPAPSADAHAPSLLVDRLWVDKIPEKDMDKFNFYIFSSEENIALNDQAQSSYRHLLEIFFYRASSRDLQYQFPHDRRSGKTQYSVEKLSKPDRNGIDLKLTLVADPQAGNTTKTYYSSTKWSSLDKSTLPPPLRHLPQAPGGLQP